MSVIFIVGIIMFFLAFLKYKRRSEAEISKDIVRLPEFIIGLVLILVSLIIEFIL
jgi:multisubunit Na+/H+ antiporter MnhB subunit